ncbi:MAG: flagellar FliJ family protein [Rhodospirillales bacterium]|nr:flagellar FliJ family protein [Rhodospirillales bacterium]
MGRGKLDTLIRLRSWDCEQGRRAVATAQARINETADRLRELVTARDRERSAAALTADARLGLSTYERRIRGEREKLAAALAAAGRELAEARGTLAAAYREKRKLELAQAERARAEAAARARRERIALDEIALNNAKSPSPEYKP